MERGANPTHYDSSPMLFPPVRVVSGSVIVCILSVYCVYIEYILCIHKHTIYPQYTHNIPTITEPDTSSIGEKAKTEND